MTKVRAKGVFFQGAASVWLSLLLFVWLPGQQNFNQQEKESIQKYKRAKVHFLKGGKFLNKGKLENARKEADTCLEIFPGYADALLLMAQISYQQGQFDQALREIETAESAFKKFSKFYEYSYLELLDLLREQRDSVDSYIFDLSVKQANITDADEKQKLQEIIDRSKQTRDTLDNRLRSPIPETLAIPADYHYNHGNILFKLKRFDEAQGFYLAAIQAEPDHANSYNNLINIFYMKGDMPQALKYLTQADANKVTVHEGLKKAILERQPPK